MKKKTIDERVFMAMWLDTVTGRFRRTHLGFWQGVDAGFGGMAFEMPESVDVRYPRNARLSDQKRIGLDMYAAAGRS